MDMMYMPDALQSIVDLIEAPADKLIHRNAFNITAMSFSPEEIADSIKKYIPDFVIEYEGYPLPIEVKSGKNYMRHPALNNVMQNKSYEIKQAIVLCNENIEMKDQIFYCPIYLAGLLKKRTIPEDYIYRIRY